MGHIQDMNDKQRSKFIALIYKRKKEANKGYNFPYFNQVTWNRLEADGYAMHTFVDHFKNNVYATNSVIEAKEVIVKLRSEGNYARIICGYIKDRQANKYFTVIYKPKKTKL